MNSVTALMMSHGCWASTPSNRHEYQQHFSSDIVSVPTAKTTRAPYIAGRNCCNPHFRFRDAQQRFGVKFMRVSGLGIADGIIRFGTSMPVCAGRIILVIPRYGENIVQFSISLWPQHTSVVESSPWQVEDGRDCIRAFVWRSEIACRTFSVDTQCPIQIATVRERGTRECMPLDSTFALANQARANMGSNCRFEFNILFKLEVPYLYQ
jgi:hypothetical protein